MKVLLTEFVVGAGWITATRWRFSISRRFTNFAPPNRPLHPVPALEMRIEGAKPSSQKKNGNHRRLYCAISPPLEIWFYFIAAQNRTVHLFLKTGKPPPPVNLQFPHQRYEFYVVAEIPFSAGCVDCSTFNHRDKYSGKSAVFHAPKGIFQSGKLYFLFLDGPANCATDSKHHFTAEVSCMQRKCPLGQVACRCGCMAAIQPAIFHNCGVWVDRKKSARGWWSRKWRFAAQQSNAAACINPESLLMNNGVWLIHAECFGQR